jgi:peptide deformylase
VTTDDDEGARLVKLMKDLAIVQAGDPILTRHDLPMFRLPEQAAEAKSLVDRLTRKADELQRRYSFRGGMGLAAPQLGVPCRAAVGRPDHEDQQIVLINPVILDEGDLVPTYEACLSLFDLRGRVLRPQWMLVEHVRFDGTVVRSRFEGVTSTLLAHEIDHLDGVLYPARLRDGEEPIPLAEYRKL